MLLLLWWPAVMLLFSRLLLRSSRYQTSTNTPPMMSESLCAAGTYALAGEVHTVEKSLLTATLQGSGKHTCPLEA